jgi:hypothetical protein
MNVPSPFLGVNSKGRKMSNLKISAKEAKLIVYNDHPNYKEIQEEIVGQRRWSTEFEGVFQNTITDKFYKIYYKRGSTECQDQELFYDDTVVLVEVEKKIVQVEKFVDVVE